MEQLRAAKGQPDTFLVDYALSARALEIEAASSLDELPLPEEVLVRDHPGEYTARLIGATDNTIQQLPPEERREFDRFLHLSRMVYPNPQRTT